MRAFLKDLAAGNEQAFGLLYEQYGTRLYRTAVGMLGNRADAEDAVQEVFASLVRSHRKLAEVNDLTAYLYATLRSSVFRCIERRRRDARRQEVAAEAIRGTSSPSSNRDSFDLESLHHATSRLPPEQREVVSLKLAGELTFAQIGEVLGICSNTAASRYRYALEKLRSELKEKSDVR